MRKPSKILFFFIATSVLFALFSCGSRAKSYDFIITNGFIIDGTGNPWFKGDIAIEGEKIVEIGSIPDNQAKKTIDAQNLTVCPGFIDIHDKGKHTGTLSGKILYGYGKR
jgi:N-acyl-D-aspartate/D-glutamate deacylase